jgi:hypothetical protein
MKGRTKTKRDIKKGRATETPMTSEVMTGESL